MRESAEDVVSVAAKIRALNRSSTRQCVFESLLFSKIYVLTSSVQAIPLRLIEFPRMPLHWLALQ